jgi:hypothetical protein
MDESYRKVGDRFIPEDQYQKELAEQSEQIQKILATQSEMQAKRNSLNWYASRNKVDHKRALITTLVAFAMMRIVFYLIAYGGIPSIWALRPTYGSDVSLVISFALVLLAIWFPARRNPMKSILVPVFLVTVAMAISVRFFDLYGPNAMVGQNAFVYFDSGPRISRIYLGSIIWLIILVLAIGRSVRAASNSADKRADQELFQVMPLLPKQGKAKGPRAFVGLFFDV